MKWCDAWMALTLKYEMIAWVIKIKINSEYKEALEFRIIRIRVSLQIIKSGKNKAKSLRRFSFERKMNNQGWTTFVWWFVLFSRLREQPRLDLSHFCSEHDWSVTWFGGSFYFYCKGITKAGPITFLLWTWLKCDLVWWFVLV